MHPKTYFDSAKVMLQSGKCFVLMPFAEGFTEIYDTIRETIESPELNFACQRADDIQGGGYIMKSVLKGIAESEIIIVDLTLGNPNVFYELGIAHTVKDEDKVILLIQKNEKIPFDLSPFRCIVYEQSISGAKKLKTELLSAVQEVADLIKLSGDAANPVYQFRVKNEEIYKFPIKLFGQGNCLYDFIISGDYIGEDGMKCRIKVSEYAAGYKPKELNWKSFGMNINRVIKISEIPWNLKLEKLSGEIATFQLISE